MTTARSSGRRRTPAWTAGSSSTTSWPRNRVDADAGRHLPAWVRAAGFSDLTITSSNWTFANPAGRAWWGGTWADRVRQSSFATQAKEYCLSDESELAEIGAGWREWIVAPNGVFVVPSVEIIARR